MTDELRLGVVGLGWIATKHIETLRIIGRNRIVAVCDVDAQRAEEIGSNLNARAYVDWRELLDSGSVDALFVCTPPLAHAAPVIEAIGQGVPVFVEKPLARQLADALEIVSVVETKEAICGVGYQWRALDLLPHLRNMLAGQDLALLSGRELAPTLYRGWFADQTQSGGDILERASHLIDLQRAICGEVIEVQAAASEVRLAREERPAATIPDAVSITLRFASGALGTIDLAWTRDGLPRVCSLDLIGTESSLCLEFDPKIVLTGESKRSAVNLHAQVDPSKENVARFLTAVREGDPSLVYSTPASAARTLSVALAAERSVDEGGIVPVPKLRL